MARVARAAMLAAMVVARGARCEERMVVPFLRTPSSSAGVEHVYIPDGDFRDDPGGARAKR
jgi:hypothetical protein